VVESPRAIELISSERDLIALPDELVRPSGMLALGGVDYERGASTRNHSARPEAAIIAAGGTDLRGVPFRALRSDCLDASGLSFEPLPGTAAEVRDLERLWVRAAETESSRGKGAREGRDVVLTGSAATESGFKSLAPRCEILHVATHGFFLGER